TKLLLKLDASVLTVDSRTPLDQKVESCQQADIVISCVGRPDQHKILEEHVKSGAMLIDIGMSAQSDTTKKGSFRLVGDIDPTAEEKSSCFVPTLNGVGPVTAAMLVRNLIDAAIQQK
ncbi:MAG TPA: hypothetical protein PKD96_00850, partial [Candidatus Absconditabacterales bacterium]|nr:hypothetical protein [Candidatus Absconditabacterales bacterium]